MESQAQQTTEGIMSTKVISIHDDSDSPIVGTVLGHEDEDRVLVAWGDSQYSDDPYHEARVEYVDQLMSYRPRS
jgi:hypothetical protein